MKFFYRLFHQFSKLGFNLFYGHKIYGSENLPKGPCILAPNHTSFLDPPLVGASCSEEIYFLAKGSLFRNRFFKAIISNLNAYPVSGTGQDIASIKQILDLLKSQHKVVIFPEGKRSYDDQIQSIKPGIAFLVSRSEAPIIPIYIHGAHEAWPRRRLFPKILGKTACIFGKPIYWNSYKDLPKKVAQEKLVQDLESALKQLQADYLEGSFS